MYAPVEAVPFVRRVAHAAYRLGAAIVSCLFEDPQLLRQRPQEAPDLTPGVPERLRAATLDALGSDAAYLLVFGPRPDLLTAVDIERIARAHAADAAWAAARLRSRKKPTARRFRSRRRRGLPGLSRRASSGRVAPAPRRVGGGITPRGGGPEAGVGGPSGFAGYSVRGWTAGFERFTSGTSGATSLWGSRETTAGRAVEARPRTVLCSRR